MLVTHQLWDRLGQVVAGQDPPDTLFVGDDDRADALQEHVGRGLVCHRIRADADCCAARKLRYALLGPSSLQVTGANETNQAGRIDQREVVNAQAS